MVQEKRKPDWGRVIAQYSIPIVLIIGAMFVAEYRLTQAEDNMVQEDVHKEIHRSGDRRNLRVDTAIEKLTNHAIETDKRIEQVNWEAKTAQTATLNKILTKINLLHTNTSPSVTWDAGAGPKTTVGGHTQ